jgi:hypothetical protein
LERLPPSEVHRLLEDIGGLLKLLTKDQNDLAKDQNDLMKDASDLAKHRSGEEERISAPALVDILLNAFCEV